MKKEDLVIYNKNEIGNNDNKNIKKIIMIYWIKNIKCTID